MTQAFRLESAGILRPGSWGGGANAMNSQDRVVGSESLAAGGRDDRPAITAPGPTRSRASAAGEATTLAVQEEPRKPQQWRAPLLRYIEVLACVIGLFALAASAFSLVPGLDSSYTRVIFAVVPVVVGGILGVWAFRRR